jgi:hypothetical protein
VVPLNATVLPCGPGPDAFGEYLYGNQSKQEAAYMGEPGNALAVGKDDLDEKP